MNKQPDNVSEICNKLADKHDLNVTVVRDILEDVRRQTFKNSTRPTYVGAQQKKVGADLYALLKGAMPIWVESLPGGSRKPAKAARRGK